MFGLTAATRIYLYRRVCNMLKSFDGLCGIVRSDLEADLLSGFESLKSNDVMDV